jgi:plastocyanin
VPAGTTIAWTNRGVNIHTIAALDGSFDSGALNTADSFAFTFTKPGTYQIICRQHLLNSMTSVVTVQ